MGAIDKILQLMNKRGVTSAQLTREAGLTNGLISQWKNGLQHPSAKSLMKLSKYFNVPLDYFSENEQKNESFTKVEGFSKEACELMEKFEKLSPANRAKMSELIDLYLSSQDKK